MADTTQITTSPVSSDKIVGVMSKISGYGLCPKCKFQQQGQGQNVFK
jgi:hypothetical protein